MIRPDLRAKLWRWREAIAALLLAGFGLRLILLGGYVLVPLGFAVLALALVWAILTARRVQFLQAVDAPGLIEVDEAQVGYLGPADGGFVSLADLVELRLLTRQGQRFWRLKQSDGQALLVPVDASGADRLYDAFASLPGMDTQALVAALHPKPAASTQTPPRSDVTLLSDAAVIWRRSVRAVLT